MTWLYLSGLIFLIGGQINAILENASPAGKEHGARAPGQEPEVQQPRATPLRLARGKEVG